MSRNLGIQTPTDKMPIRPNTWSESCVRDLLAVGGVHPYGAGSLGLRTYTKHILSGSGLCDKPDPNAKYIPNWATLLFPPLGNTGDMINEVIIGNDDDASSLINAGVTCRILNWTVKEGPYDTPLHETNNAKQLPIAEIGQISQTAKDFLPLAGVIYQIRSYEEGEPSPTATLYIDSRIPHKTGLDLVQYKVAEMCVIQKTAEGLTEPNLRKISKLLTMQTIRFP